jgi:hypothetical protein
MRKIAVYSGHMGDQTRHRPSRADMPGTGQPTTRRQRRRSLRRRSGDCAIDTPTRSRDE